MNIKIIKKILILESLIILLIEKTSNTLFLDFLKKIISEKSINVKKIETLMSKLLKKKELKFTGIFDSKKKIESPPFWEKNVIIEILKKKPK